MAIIEKTNASGPTTNGHASLTPPEIIDIRTDTAALELTHMITAGLTPQDDGEKTLPTLLLYDENGLKLFEKITYLDEYYLTNDEIDVLKENAAQLADRIPEGAMVVELGSGNLRKVNILLGALEKAKKQIDYYALDLMRSELERTLDAIPNGTYTYVKSHGLQGTYDDGLAWLQNPANAARPKTVLSMGSSIGNFSRNEAAAFLHEFAAILKADDIFLIGVDACQDPEKVHHAYNDRHGITHEFTLNGLRHANHLLGYDAFVEGDWEAIGEYDAALGCHRAWVSPKKSLQIEGVTIKKGERIRIEESYKYSSAQANELWADAGVMEAAFWTNSAGSYALHLLRPIHEMFATTPEQYAPHPVPSVQEWHSLWALWDKVTRQMIPNEELLEKPIKLRNACIFYLGHIPTFFDIKLTEAAGLEPTEPRYFRQIFERGIDPDVDDPEQCHAHSEIPDSWPELDVILKYQDSVRQRVLDLYKYSQAYTDNWTGRTLWLGFEHELMHMETLLYMLVQSEKTLPPSGTVKPDFAQLASQSNRQAVPNEWFDIPEQTLTIGLDDADNGDGPVRHFGWDVEKPAKVVTIPAFKAQARAITNGEYARYLIDTGSKIIPSSWIYAPSTNGVVENADATNGDADLHAFVQGKAVRTVYGPVALQYALDWPVSASYDELHGCAKYMGGRIPTMEQTRSIYEYAAVLKTRDPSKTLGKAIPAVNGHLINNGVRESPPSAPSATTDANAQAAGPDPKDLYMDLTNANVGFKHWHPMPIVQLGAQLAGQGELGGLWEWTSSALQRREGFVPMKLYPAYSADFYDGKHNIVLGGSWATHPRFAGRKSVVNWYQRNYPYVWAGARLVKDI